MTTSVYVYYRVDADRAAEAKVAIDALVADMRRRTGVAGRLLRRRDDPSTWMEIYEPIDDAGRFTAALSEAVVRHGAASYLQPAGTRVLELFVPID